MNPRDYYNSRIEKVSVELSEHKKKAFLFSMLRLATFLATCIIAYFFIGNVKLVLGTVAIA